MFRIAGHICKNVSSESWLETTPEAITERVLIFPESEFSHRWIFLSSGGTGPGSSLRDAISGALNWRPCAQDPRCPKSQAKTEVGQQVSLKDLP